MATTTETSGPGTPVRITAGGRTFDATINDSQVSKDFLATLPTTLNWDRNGSIEYITELAAPITETGPFYTDVEAGDIEPGRRRPRTRRPTRLVVSTTTPTAPSV